MVGVEKLTIWGWIRRLTIYSKDLIEIYIADYLGWIRRLTIYSKDLIEIYIAADYL